MANTFSTLSNPQQYPCLMAPQSFRKDFFRLNSGKKCPICLVVLGGSFFSSQAPYPYLFLGWHNKEKECQERTHTPSLFEGSESSGSPYRRQNLTSLNRHYSLSAPTTRPSSACRARPWPLLVYSSRSSFFAPLPLID